MKTIRIWGVEEKEDGQRTVVPTETVENTETEELLEELLVQSPELLMDGLILVGRQVPAGGGALDLLGLDEDGRLVVFELKRGTLTRDAVAQVLDYASELAEMDAEQIATLIEDASGRLGIEKIDDFSDFYQEQYPSSSSVLDESPYMVLVGLGADDRARRIVNFLAATSVEIELLTFHAFQSDGKLLLARQAEQAGHSGESRPRAYTKQSNLKVLRAGAQSLGVNELLERVGKFISDHLPGAYQWPGKTGYSFSLTETTERGSKSYRVYVNVNFQSAHPGRLYLTVMKRAVDAAGATGRGFCQSHASNISHDEKWGTSTLPFRQEDWANLERELGPVLDAMLDGWKLKEAGEAETDRGPEDAEAENVAPPAVAGRAPQDGDVPR